MDSVSWTAFGYKLACGHASNPKDPWDYQNLEYWKGKTLFCRYCEADSEVVSYLLHGIQFRDLEYAKRNRKE